MRKIKEFYGLPIYMLRHPFEGFYRMKFGQEGRMGVAFLNFFLLWISVSFMSQYASITVATPFPLAHNSLADGASLFGLLVLWSLANWSVTSLTEGEGKFKEIFMANCYAMTPLVITLVPVTLFSHGLTNTEGAFFFMIVTIAIVWFILLVYVGMVTVHGYTAGKALRTVFLTFIAMLIIVFLGTLMIVLIQQMYSFGVSIYTELIYR